MTIRSLSIAEKWDKLYKKFFQTAEKSWPDLAVASQSLSLYLSLESLSVSQSVSVVSGGVELRVLSNFAGILGPHKAGTIGIRQFCVWGDGDGP